MEKSPCRGCIHEFDSKADCLPNCNMIGRVQKLSHQVMPGKTRSDYAFAGSHAVASSA